VKKNNNKKMRIKFDREKKLKEDGIVRKKSILEII
jgi:hypothetical protein